MSCNIGYIGGKKRMTTEFLNHRHVSANAIRNPDGSVDLWVTISEPTPEKGLGTFAVTGYVTITIARPMREWGDAEKLAAAVLAGDTDASIALSDEVRMRHLEGENFVSREAMEKRIAFLERSVALYEAENWRLRCLFGWSHTVVERIMKNAPTIGVPPESIVPDSLYVLDWRREDPLRSDSISVHLVTDTGVTDWEPRERVVRYAPLGRGLESSEMELKQFASLVVGGPYPWTLPGEHGEEVGS